MSIDRTSPAVITAAEFEQLMSCVLDAGGLCSANVSVAVAFSGGPDSLALLFLAARWAKKSKRRKLIALTVDHGLRAESAAEAKTCAAMGKRLGVTHRILVWKGKKPESGIQAAARDARYRLMTEACRKEGVDALLVAHHLEDQAETFLLRLARGSGVDGLAAMPISRIIDDVCLLRPLLSLPKARLNATIKASSLTAVEDPSNANERFERVKARRLMTELASLGLGAQRLADTAHHMARARAALESETRKLLSHATLMPAGYIVMDAKRLADAPEEISLRALAEIFRWVNGHDYAPRFEALQAVHQALMDGSLKRARTLNGCKIAVDGKEQLRASRELAAVLKTAPSKISKGTVCIWDGRFRLRLTKVPSGFKSRDLEVRALGSEGMAALRAAKLEFPALPTAIATTLPALWEGEKLLAAPILDPLVDPLVQGFLLETEVVASGLFR